MPKKNIKPKIAIHKFSSCDGCQLAFLNSGEELLLLAELVDIVHFAEAGPLNPNARVDIAFIEGSISTPEELERIKLIRDHSKYLIPIGACATAGGLQALRNLADDSAEWLVDIYPYPEHISTLNTATPISEHVTIDFEIWGCPVTTKQLLQVTRMLLTGIEPYLASDSVCIECKQDGKVCVLVTQGLPCMGPVTRMGCGAICPAKNRDCYECFGPAENPNCLSLGKKFARLGVTHAAIARRFLFINSQAPAFKEIGKHFSAIEEES